jgi:REDY-like protein HapK
VTLVYWLVRLKEGVTAEDYEAFVRRVDYPAVARIASIRSYRSTRVSGTIPPQGGVPFDFVDMVEVDDLKAYLRDLETHPAVEEVHSQSANMVEVLHCVVAEPVAKA